VMGMTKGSGVKSPASLPVIRALQIGTNNYEQMSYNFTGSNSDDVNLNGNDR